MKWNPGQSGNPAGRPKKGESLAEALRVKLAEDEGRRLDLIAEKLIGMAQGGNIAAIKLIFERVDGAIPKAIEDGGPVEIKVTFEDEEEARRTLAELSR
jgi:hypothetical protein